MTQHPDFPPLGGHDPLCAYAAGMSRRCTCTVTTQEQPPHGGYGSHRCDGSGQKATPLRLADPAVNGEATTSDGWVVCSPEWLATGGDCHNSPRRTSTDPRYSHEHHTTALSA